MLTKQRTPRHEYPICPECGGPVAAAMMTSGAVHAGGQPFDAGKWHQGESLWYAPSALSVYCVSGDCNYDKLLSEIPTPVPAEQNKDGD